MATTSKVVGHGSPLKTQSKAIIIASLRSQDKTSILILIALIIHNISAFFLRGNMILSEIRKERVKNECIKGAQKYNRLIGKHFEITIENGETYIVQFNKEDFQHLTGVKSTFTNRAFFTNCLNATITCEPLHLNDFVAIGGASLSHTVVCCPFRGQGLPLYHTAKTQCLPTFRPIRPHLS